MKKIFISQPMVGKTTANILEERAFLEKELSYLFGPDEPFEIIQSVFKGPPSSVIHPRVFMLGKALTAMGEADLVIFMPSWDLARGCKVEHFVAKLYDLNIVDMNDKTWRFNVK